MEDDRDASTPPAPLPPSGATPPLQRAPESPFEWVTLVIALYLLLAVGAVVGGFLEAGNHSHRVVHADEFGLGRIASDQRDYNYAYAGIAAGIAWASLAILMALVRSIARDARRSADALRGDGSPSPTGGAVR